MAALSIPERVAWFHHSAVKLKATDLTSLKFAVKDMIEQADKLLEQIDTEIKVSRPRFIED